MEMKRAFIIKTKSRKFIMKVEQLVEQKSRMPV